KLMFQEVQKQLM
ncbi:putative hemoglobin and hemoglobin-haptoglobin-binding protein 3 precursor, partial [Haemophilus influenzae]